MKYKSIILLVLVSFLYNGDIQSQILNIPEGTSGIGNSTNGNVGIGTITPLAKLDITGNNMYLGGHNGDPQYLANWTSAGVWGIGSLDNGKNVIRLGAVNHPDMTWNTAAPCNLEVGGNNIYLSGHNGNPQYIGNWKSTGVWGIGALDNEKNIIRIGAINYPDFTWNSSLACNVEIQGGLNIVNNVGIGTQNPAYKLDVLGTIHAKEVLVNLDGGADFVFEKDYKLPTIEHVANYVQENKHLPDIPSANEMVKNGVSMGDMQVKLLQKVEELTLYVIELKKEINILKQEHR